MRTELSLDDVNDAAKAEGCNHFTIAIEIGDIQKHQELEAVFTDNLATDGTETYVTIEGEYGPDEEGSYGWRRRVLRPAGRHGDPSPFLARMAKQIPLFFLGAVRDAEREMRATGRGSLSQLLQEIDFDDVQNEILTNIHKANEALSKNSGINTLSQNISTLVTPQIPGNRTEVSIKVASEDAAVLSKGLRLNLKRPADHKEYDVSRHGTGLQNLVLIAMFRHRITQLTTGQPILTIEEPEAHLHPQAQRCLYKDIQNIGTPVIITTHSTNLVECCSPLSIIRLVSDSNNETRAHQINRAALDSTDVGLLGKMMRSGRAAAFFARAIIVVEGQCEEIALPNFARTMGYDLDKDGISIVSVEGNSFSFILRACDAENFDIPAVITFDTDALEDNNDLVKEAYKAKLINEEIYDNCRKKGSADRKDALKTIGWIPVESNFEEECANSGYLETMLKLVEQEGASTGMETYLKNNGFNEDARGIARFLNNGGRKASRLKIPIAHTIADSVTSVGQIPTSYAKAINDARKYAKVTN